MTRRNTLTYLGLACIGGLAFWTLNGCQAVQTISTAIQNASPAPSAPKVLVINNNPTETQSAAQNSMGSYEVGPTPPLINIQAVHPQFLNFSVLINGVPLTQTSGTDVPGSGTSGCNNSPGCYSLNNKIYENASGQPILDAHGNTQTLEMVSLFNSSILVSENLTLTLKTTSYNPQYATLSASVNEPIGSRVPEAVVVRGGQFVSLGGGQYAFEFQMQLPYEWVDYISYSDSGNDMSGRLQIQGIDHAFLQPTFEIVAPSSYGTLSGHETFTFIAHNQAGASPSASSSEITWTAAPTPVPNPTFTRTPQPGMGACSGGSQSFLLAAPNTFNCLTTAELITANSLSQAQQCATVYGGTASQYQKVVDSVSFTVTDSDGDVVDSSPCVPETVSGQVQQCETAQWPGYTVTTGPCTN